jgi:predicted metalloprotease with PDZ domain
VNAATFAKRVGDAAPGARVPIAFFRRDLLREATLTLAESPARTWTVTADPLAHARAKSIRAGWLGAGRRA